MRSSFLSFASDVSKEQCQAEHWIDIENVSESVKMTPEEIENLNARILRTYGTEMHDLKNEAFAKEERVVYDKWCGNFLSFGIQGINWTVRDAQNSVDKNVHIKYGIATSQGLIKQFPMETFLADEEDPSDPEWDEAALCLCMVGEPLLILGSVQEEGYLYVQNECSEGWISAESVAVCRNRAEWLMAAFPIHPLVVTGDMVWLEASAVYPGTSAYRLRMGTVLELCVEEGIPEIKETIETKVLNLYEASNPSFYYVYEVLGDYYAAIQQTGTAIIYWQKALTMPIPKQAEKVRIQQKINKKQ